MLDRHLHPRIKPLLHQCVKVLDKPGITPDGLTLVGFAIGVLALPFWRWAGIWRRLSSFC